VFGSGQEGENREHNGGKEGEIKEKKGGIERKMMDYKKCKMKRKIKGCSRTDEKGTTES
jgi:hypothetical protein